jgi:hypothetical protein
MRTEPLVIGGLAGPVVLESSFLASRYTVTVGGQQANRTGRGRYELPAAAGGTVQAMIRGGFLDIYPTLEINGIKHRTGPAAPLVLRVLALVPLVLIGLGGAVGGLIGVLGVMVNMAVGRLQIHAVLRALLMIGVLGAAVGAWTVVAAAISTALT